ncbi:N-6 DNA methylase [Streptococcus dysgalactiae]|uniref:N-6 DNA methylase n=1 Tax=Streptococcus dysgalactiae TaxID=1334 RepID=UPI00186769D7|nr:N-6 DNA methylase [Streptococcus dysgalactiae]
MAVLKSNERSEAIELIKESQIIFSKNDFVFKEASGEQSLGKNGNDDDRANTLFPDVIYYNDNYQTQVALGWELKMPDTDIHDSELFSNAVDKADRLKTNAFVLWNFKETLVYYRSQSGSWELSQSWNVLNFNNTREDVITNRDKWKNHLQEVVIHLNSLFQKKIVSSIPILSSVDNLAENIAQKFSLELSRYYKTLGDRKFVINVKRWYDQELMEFSSEHPKKISDDVKLQMFAKYTLLSWVNRVTFSNLLRSTHNSVHNALITLLDESSFENVQGAFNNATNLADFYTILHCEDSDMLLSDTAKSVIREYTAFLIDKTFDYLEQDEFRSTLENIIDISKRELMGLFTTPKKLAKFLVQSTIANTDSNMIDPCVGSGTIASAMMELVSSSKNVEFAHEHVWASDKYKMPLQVANISLSTKDSLNLANKVYQKDLLSQMVGDVIDITDPRTGELNSHTLPEFDYVISNLPFIRSERLENDKTEKMRVKEVNDYLVSRGIEPIRLKNDWYQFGIIGIERILKEKGKLAVITSNSWLKTKHQSNYIETLFELFDVNKVIISANKKWFNNADVVSVILVATKITGYDINKNENIQFIKLLSDINSMPDAQIEELSESLLMDECDAPSIEAITYSRDEISKLVKSGISLNTLFNDMSWFDSVRDVILPMKDVFEGKRGVKSTNDEFFYDIPSSENIEKEYLVPLLKTIRNTKGYFAEADSNAFVVDKTLEQLKVEGKEGAVGYIEKFESLPKKVSQAKLKNWYQLPDTVYGDFVTSLNPDRRLFWLEVSDNLLINQRLTVFKLKDARANKELIHALLNTYFGQFMIEATGFGRGLGALDTTKDGILESSMLNYNLFTPTEVSEIVESWRELSKNDVPDILEQLADEKWYKFNELVFNKLGKKELLPYLVKSFKKLVQMRINSRN